MDAARRDTRGLRRALGLTERQSAHVEEGAALRTSPTLPALRRYTGVVYENLDYAALRGAAKRRAEHRLVLDLRSGAYTALARARPAVQVRVLRESGGRRIDLVLHGLASARG